MRGGEAEGMRKWEGGRGRDGRKREEWERKMEKIA